MTRPNRPQRRKSHRHAANSIPASQAPVFACAGNGSSGSVGKQLKTGLQLHQAGRHREAMACYQAVLELDPGNSEALHLSGVIAYQLGQHQTAVDLIRAAINRHPGVGNYHLNLGCALLARAEQRDALEAICCFEQALRLEPGLVLAHNNLANALRKQGRIQEALIHYQHELDRHPEHPTALNNLASLWIELDELEQAQALLIRALQLDPEFAEAHCNLALIEARRGSGTAAIENYHKGLARQPGLLQGWTNMGELLATQGAVAEATAALGQAAQLDSRAFRKLKARTVCPVIAQTSEEIQNYRTHLAQQLEQFRECDLELSSCDWEGSALNPPFYLPYQGLNDLPLKVAWAKLFESNFPKRELAAREGKSHVGFVVANRHVPVFWKFVGGAVQRLPDDELEVTIVGSTSSQRELSAYLNSPRVRFLVIPPNLVAAAEIMEQARFDALYYFEPEADAICYFLASQQLAPVQCTSWGIPVTSGLSAMTDYLSCTLIEPPNAQQHYRETLTQLNRLPVFFHRPPPLQIRTRDHFGFRDRDRLYGCAQSLFKFHPEFDSVLAAILRGDSAAKLVLVEGRQAMWSQLLKQRWGRTMPDVIDRIQILPQQSPNDFRALLACCDVLLDPFPFGGGATTYDAMSVGTPTVTLPGEFMRGRVTAGSWTQMGVLDCITDSVEDYVETCLQIANQPDWRADLKQRILSSSEQLFEDPGAVVELRNWLLERIHRSRN